MAGHVIERLGTTIGDDGIIYHDDKPLSWQDADAKAGFRLDRRKAWAFIPSDRSSELCEVCTWSSACSGCNNELGADRGMGCEECGYTGRSRNAQWIPAATPPAAEQEGR